MSNHKIEDKFIVIAKKDIVSNVSDQSLCCVTRDLIVALRNYTTAVESNTAPGFGKKFYVCNQDEPYANDVIELILKGEDAK